VAKGSPNEKVFRVTAPQANVMTADDDRACLALLKQSQVAAVSDDETNLFLLVKQDATTKILPGYLTDEPHGIGFAKNRAGFTDWMNAELKRMVTDGRWATLYQQWISPLSGDSKRNPEGGA